MKIRERAAHAAQVLEELYPQVPIPLDHTSPYTLLVAVLLSAQCTDKRVNQITPTLFQLADNPVDMAQQSVDEVEDIVRPCGLGPRKARAIVELSQLLLDNHSGDVPKDLDALVALPGVGRKTALVVRSQAWNIPGFPVDTHIQRLALRWRLTKSSNVRIVERDLCRLFPSEKWNKLHLQVIYYGREYCTARGCDGTKCQLCATFNGKRRGKARS